MGIKSLFVCGLLLLAGLITPLTAHAQGMRPATKMAVGEITHFTLKLNESQDFAVQLGAGSYYIAMDMKRVDEKPSNIIARVQLLKTNGVMVNGMLMNVNETGVTTRRGEIFKQVKPLTARLRVNSDTGTYEVWMRVVLVAKMAFTPFLSGDGDIKPLGIGGNDGKGGTLKPYEWAYHSATLPAGKYDVTLYMKRVDGRSSNIIGYLQQMDVYGFDVNGGRINMNESGTEARKEMRLVLKKPTKVLFHVINDDAPMEYTVGIDKATD